MILTPWPEYRAIPHCALGDFVALDLGSKVKRKHDIIVNTVSPDLLFEKCHGELHFIGRDLHAIVLLVEFALPRNVKYHRLPIESEKAKAKKYFDMMPDGVFSVGRAGSYLYNVDIDETIRHAREVRDKLKS
jgi:UDP-galactopyranose mutase